MANINKNIIMQAGASVANATNKAAGLSASTPEPGSIISSIQLVNGGRTIGPDALAHFTESVRNKLLSLLVSMEPIQDFNGYGHPWPAGGGKNLFDIDARIVDTTSSTGTPYPNAYTKNGDAVTISKNLNQNGRVMFSAQTLAAGTYTLSFTVSLSGTGLVTYSVRNMSADPKADIVENTYAQVGSINRTFTVSEDASVAISILPEKSTGGTATITSIQLETGSTATAFAPYSNICPISGRTGLNVYAGPTSAIGDATTYSMDWTSPAGTVYAGSSDIVSGNIKAAPYYASYNGETLVGPWVSSMDVYDPEGTPTTGAQVVDLGGAMTEYHITGQDIITLVGDNYIWSDSGDVTITE